MACGRAKVNIAAIACHRRGWLATAAGSALQKDGLGNGQMFTRNVCVYTAERFTGNTCLHGSYVYRECVLTYGRELVSAANRERAAGAAIEAMLGTTCARRGSSQPSRAATAYIARAGCTNAQQAASSGRRSSHRLSGARPSAARSSSSDHGEQDQGVPHSNCSAARIKENQWPDDARAATGDVLRGRDPQLMWRSACAHTRMHTRMHMHTPSQARANTHAHISTYACKRT